MNKVASSFRDPAGFIYKKNDTLYRQINEQGAQDYDAFMARLYPTLLERNLIVKHDEVSQDLAYSADAYKIIQPELIPFISYPYEWTFEQLKDAALLTLRIQKIAMKVTNSLQKNIYYYIKM